MSHSSGQFEEETIARCDVCDEYIEIDFYLDAGDLVCCEECDSEYIIKSRDPIVLLLLTDDYDEYDDDDFDDEYSSRGYD